MVQVVRETPAVEVALVKSTLRPLAGVCGLTPNGASKLFVRKDFGNSSGCGSSVERLVFGGKEIGRCWPNYSTERGVASRIFQPWQKKRGHRRTGSQLAGSVGEGVIFASLLLVGSFALIALITSRVVDIPGISTLNTGSGLWLSVIGLTSLILIGAGGVIWTLLSAGTSAERRKSITEKSRPGTAGSVVS